MFGAVLTKLRQEAGFESAYRFYHSSGAKKAFGCGYHQYLNFERNRSLPSPGVLFKIAGLLYLGQKESKVQEYVLAYLRSSWGEEAVRYLVAPLLAVSKQERGQYPLGMALKRVQEATEHKLSETQAQLIKESYSNYWTWMMLSNAKRSWDAQTLSSALGIEGLQAQASLNALYEVRLLKKDRDGTYFCPNAGRLFVYPGYGPKLHLPADYAKLESYWKEMEGRRGELVYQRPILFRASEGHLMNYLPYLTQAILGSQVYSTLESNPDTALYLVEGRVRKMA